MPTADRDTALESPGGKQLDPPLGRARSGSKLKAKRLALMKGRHLKGKIVKQYKGLSMARGGTRGDRQPEDSDGQA